MNSKNFNLVLSILSFLLGLSFFIMPIGQLGSIVGLMIILNLGVAIREINYYRVNHRVFSKIYLINPIITIVLCIFLATQGLFNLGLLIPQFISFWILMLGMLRMYTGIIIRKINRNRSNMYIITSIITVFLSIFILNYPVLFAKIIGYTIGFMFIEQAVYMYKTYLKYDDIK